MYYDNPDGVSVHDGFPNPATDATIQPIDLNKLLIKNSAATYMMRVTGDHWQRLGIFNSDIVIVDRAVPSLCFTPFLLFVFPLLRISFLPVSSLILIFPSLSRPPFLPTLLPNSVYIVPFCSIPYSLLPSHYLPLFSFLPFCLPLFFSPLSISSYPSP